MRGAGVAFVEKCDAIACVVERYQDRLTLKDLAASADLPTNTLTRMFNRRYGMSPMRWVWRFRTILAAESIARAPEWSLLDVATHCGFTSAAHFSRRFRELFQESPSKCRANYHERPDVALASELGELLRHRLHPRAEPGAHDTIPARDRRFHHAAQRAAISPYRRSVCSWFRSTAWLDGRAHAPPRPKFSPEYSSLVFNDYLHSSNSAPTRAPYYFIFLPSPAPFCALANIADEPMIFSPANRFVLQQVTGRATMRRRNFSGRGCVPTANGVIVLHAIRHRPINYFADIA